MQNGLNNYEKFADWMDSRFRIPGTNVRFGLDALIGLIPGAGDFAGFLLSALMVLAMAGSGASGFVVARMMLNIIVDALIGSIPILGDLFDVAFKANQRNLRLMREHYTEGKHRGSALKLVIPLLLLIILLLAGVAWLAYSVVKWIWHLLQ